MNECFDIIFLSLRGRLTCFLPGIKVLTSHCHEHEHGGMAPRAVNKAVSGTVNTYLHLE